MIVFVLSVSRSGPSFFRPALKPDYLQKLSEDDTTGQILKKKEKETNKCMSFLFGSLQHRVFGDHERSDLH